jgi:hypothetical protein
MQAQPNMEALSLYRSRMSDQDSRRELWASVSALMQARWGRENLTRLGREVVKSPANAKRLKDQKTSVGVEMLDRVANWAGLQAWQLLVPGFSAAQPPQLQGRPTSGGMGTSPATHAHVVPELTAQPEESPDAAMRAELLTVFELLPAGDKVALLQEVQDRAARVLGHQLLAEKYGVVTAPHDEMATRRNRLAMDAQHMSSPFARKNKQEDAIEKKK